MERFARDQLFIGGQWMKPSKDERISIVSPVTEEAIGSAAAAGLADVEIAVGAARQALKGEWVDLDLAARAALIRRAADYLDERGREITELLAWEMGSPVGTGGYLRSPLTRMRESFPAAAARVQLREVRRNEEGAALLQQIPIGVVAAITPWNTAFGGVILKTIPALLAGCPVLLKPSPQTALDPYYLAEALEWAGLPGGMFNILPGGSDVGEAMVQHPGVDMVTFTGSSAVGRAIAAMASGSMKRVVLECGGKSAAIVLEDANLEECIRVIAGANFSLSGQYCRALSRVLAPRSRHQEVVDAIVEAARSIRIGDPFDEASKMGPLVSAAQRDRTERYVAVGREEGAVVVLGGQRPEGLPVGYYFEPTVFVGVENSMRIAQEEIFGPVVSVIAYDDVDEAIAIANDSSYGLSGAVFTEDFDEGLRVASAIESGLVGINAQGARESVPCGGVKLSGMGDEHGPEGFQEFLQPKAVIIPELLAARLEAAGTPSVRLS